MGEGCSIGLLFSCNSGEFALGLVYVHPRFRVLSSPLRLLRAVTLELVLFLVMFARWLNGKVDRWKEEARRDRGERNSAM